MPEGENTRILRYLIAAILVVPGVYTQAAAAELSLTVTQIAENGSSSCRRPHNAGLRAKNKTFICWAGPKMAPCIRMYDHKAGKWSKTITIYPYSNDDYHDYPTLVRDGDDYLHAFWTRHNRDIHHCKSPAPLEIEGKWTHQTVKHAGATYPCPIVGRNGNIFLFYRGRGNPTKSHADYLISTDGGKNWERKHDAISTKYNGRLRGFYLQHTLHELAHGDIPDRYHFVWSLRWNPHSTLINVYFAYFYPSTARFEAADGTDLGESISDEETEQFCIVKQTENAWWGLLSHYLYNGYPIVFYSTKTKKEIKRFFARWTGKGWDEYSSPFPYMEIEKIGPGSIRVYTKEKGDLAWWETYDGGRTWQKKGEQKLPGKSFSRCILIDNHSPTLKLFVKHDDEWNPQTYHGKDRILVAGEQ